MTINETDNTEKPHSAGVQVEPIIIFIRMLAYYEMFFARLSNFLYYQGLGVFAPLRGLLEELRDVSN